MVEHVNILDADRHEAKGASIASLNQVLHSNGDGTTSFRYLSYDNLLNQPAQQGYTSVLFGFSGSAAQQPTAVNTPIQVEFGGGVVATEATLSTAGTVTFSQAGQYLMNYTFTIGRNDSDVGSSTVFIRLTVNDTQVSQPIAVKMPEAGSVITSTPSIVINAAAGDEVKVELYRDNSGINAGGLVQVSANLAGWSNSPTASVNVSKFRGTSV